MYSSKITALPKISKYCAMGQTIKHLQMCLFNTHILKAIKINLNFLKNIKQKNKTVTEEHIVCNTPIHCKIYKHYKNRYRNSYFNVTFLISYNNLEIIIQDFVNDAQTFKEIILLQKLMLIS